MQNFSPAIMEFNFRGTEIRIDTEAVQLKVGQTICGMSPTYNTDLLSAYKDGKVFMDIKDEINEYPKQPIYLCSRNVFERMVQGKKVILDFLIYNNKEDVLPGDCLNRSKGHVNDIRELEVFQVLKGKVLSLFKNSEGEKFYGIFAEGEYYHVPSGWFHCTYILEGPAVVANFYMNTFWETDLSMKPYFDIDNDVTIEKISNKVIVKERGGEEFCIDEIGNRYKGYELISDEFYKKIAKFRNKNIFKMFYAEWNEELRRNNDEHFRYSCLQP